MRCLGEMTTWIPLPGATPRFCSRFVDEALGFAVGWNQWYNCAITVCAEISAAAAVIQFWNDTISVSSILSYAVFMTSLCETRTSTLTPLIARRVDIYYPCSYLHIQSH